MRRLWSDSQRNKDYVQNIGGRSDISPSSNNVYLFISLHWLEGKLLILEYHTIWLSVWVIFFVQSFFLCLVANGSSKWVMTPSILPTLWQNGLRTAKARYEWPSQSPDLSHIENVWAELKKRVRARKPTNLTWLHLLCQEEWAKIHPTYCGKLVEGYPETFDPS